MSNFFVFAFFDFVIFFFYVTLFTARCHAVNIKNIIIIWTVCNHSFSGGGGVAIPRCPTRI